MACVTEEQVLKSCEHMRALCRTQRSFEWVLGESSNGETNIGKTQKDIARQQQPTSHIHAEFGPSGVQAWE